MFMPLQKAWNGLIAPLKVNNVQYSRNIIRPCYGLSRWYYFEFIEGSESRLVECCEMDGSTDDSICCTALDIPTIPTFRELDSYESLMGCAQ